MARFRASFDMIKYSRGGGKSIATTSVTVTAESEQTAMLLAYTQARAKTMYREYECNLTRIDRLRG